MLVHACLVQGIELYVTDRSSGTKLRAQGILVRAAY